MKASLLSNLSSDCYLPGFVKLHIFRAYMRVPTQALLLQDKQITEPILHPDQVPAIPQRHHDAKGHFSESILAKRLRGVCFWPHRPNDIENYYKVCLVRLKTAPRMPRSASRHIGVPAFLCWLSQSSPSFHIRAVVFQTFFFCSSLSDSA